MAELPVSEFIQTRLKEYDSTFEVRKGTAFYDFFVGPMQVMLQPFRDEADEIVIGQSLRRILQQDDPDAFNEEIVDDLVANVFVTRYEGGGSSGVARVYYDNPVDREYPAGGFVVTGSNGLNYTNPASFSVTTAQMSAQYEDGLYYFDIPIKSETDGEDTELEEDNLVTVVGDDAVTYVTNKNPISGGRNRETNTQLIERARESITVRDLVTGKGFQSIMFETFPDSLTEAQAIGFGDKEMMRDILFNTHVGGKHDGFVKTSKVTRKEQDFYTVLIDETRSTNTTTQIQMSGTGWLPLGEVNVDRTDGDPIVKEVKADVEAILTSTVNLSLPINLSSNQYLKITLDGVTKTVRVAGTQPSQTKRSEIANSINNAFGVDVCFLFTNTIRLISPTRGLDSTITVTDPDSPLDSNSALQPLFGTTTGVAAYGDGPIVFQEDLHYEIDNENGQIRRIVSTEVPVEKGPGNEASISGVITPTDLVVTTVPLLFAPVDVNDILTIVSGPYSGDYRVLELSVGGNNQVIRIDTEIDANLDLTDNFLVRRTGIKEGELVFIDFSYNPLSIDIGKYIALDEYGRERGIRPGREANTIQDVAFLRIVSIEVIDSVSGEPLGIVLEGKGGYGRGGYGQGAYGIGSNAEYRLVVNKPAERYSAFEDSYIVLNSSYQGFSLRITYDCIPEIEDYHTFVRSDLERVLDGDVLIKHFIPVFVSMSVTYSVDSTDSTIPTNEELIEAVQEFINTRKSGLPLQVSDITQFILKTVDPYFRYGAKVSPFTLEGEIHNTDGTISIISDNDALTVPEEDPFPLETDSPLSPRISHWIADNIDLVRV